MVVFHQEQSKQQCNKGSTSGLQPDLTFSGLNGVSTPPATHRQRKVRAATDMDCIPGPAHRAPPFIGNTGSRQDKTGLRIPPYE